MSTLYYESSISHHGIKGQKWGVRRFQDTNGRLTAAGRARRMTGSSEDNRKVTVSESREAAKALAVTSSAIAAAAATRMALYTWPALTLAITVPATLATVTTVATVGVVKSVKEKHTETADFKKKDGPVEDLKCMKKIPPPPETIDSSYKKVNDGKPKLGTGRETNCASCSMAIDLRQKGYDVRARRQNKGLTTKDIARMYKNPKVKSIKTSRPNQTYQGLYDDICNNIRSDNKGNSSGLFLITWMGGCSGHVVYYKSMNGKVEFYDGQTGKMGAKLDRYLVDMEPEMCEYIRTDNLEPSDLIGECVVSRKDK